MSKIARRKKTVELDGAAFIITPLTYKEMTEYGELSAEWEKQSGNVDLNKLSQSQREMLQRNTFYVIRCGLNGALQPGAEQITDDDIRAEMDDMTAGKLFRAIIEFTGLKLPSEEEIRRKMEAGAPAEGETKADS